MRKRALTGAIVLTLALALGLIAAPVAGADEAPPERATVSLWAGIEGWLQDLLAGWFGAEEVQSLSAEYQNTANDPVYQGPGQAGGDGTSTTDGGSVEDPDG